MENKNKVDLTVISIDKGIITLIEEDGTFGVYRQTGIEKYKGDQLYRMIKAGLLDANWRLYQVIPDNYSISYEDPMIQGRAYKSFNPNRVTK